MSRKKAPAGVKAAADRADASSNGKDPYEGVEVPLHMQARTPAKRKAKGTKRSTAKPAPVAPVAAAAAVEMPAEAAQDASPPEAKEGRPTKYRPEFARIAKVLCSRGATDAELAEEFEVCTTTIWRWQTKHEEFCNALIVSKGAYDDRVERSMAQRAVGYSYNSEKIFHHQGSITRAKCIEHMPPDPGAGKLWLTNRRGWREKSETTVKGDGFLALWRAMGEPGALDALLRYGPPQA